MAYLGSLLSYLSIIAMLPSRFALEYQCISNLKDAQPLTVQDLLLGLSGTAIWAAEIITTYEPGFQQSTYGYLLQFILLPVWLLACLAISVILPLVLCGGTLVAMMLREGFRRLIVYLRFGLYYDPIHETYLRYTFNDSDSRLMRLPAEIRNMIWLAVLDLPKSVMILPGRPVQMNRSSFTVCRQIYTEMDQLLYSRHIFCLSRPQDLVHFVDGLNYVQRRNLRKLYIYTDPECFRFADRRGGSASSLTRSSVILRNHVGLLPCLREVCIIFHQEDPAGDPQAAQGLWELLTTFKVTGLLFVNLIEDWNLVHPTTHDLAAWSLAKRMDFANAVRTKVRWPDSQVSYVESDEDLGRPRYGLFYPLPSR